MIVSGDENAVWGCCEEADAWSTEMEWVTVEELFAPHELRPPSGATSGSHRDPAEHGQPSMSELVWIRRGRVGLDD